MIAPKSPHAPIRRLLVVLPNWVGDVVLATPALAALRAHFAGAHISFLLRRYVADVVAGGGWHDELLFWPPNGGGELRTHWRFAGQLRAARFDAALLLTNAFRSALTSALAGVPRRVGSARDGRGWLLTDRLRPLREHGEFVPRSVLTSYVELAERLGAPVEDRMPRLAPTPEQTAAGEALKQHYRLETGRYAVINPGAKFGAAKCWLPEHFADVCARLAREFDLQPVLVGAPAEAPLLEDIARRTVAPVVRCDRPATTLGSLKILIRDARVLVCNDTGPRHYGIALRTPTVTIFGPTHQEWTTTPYTDEIRLQAPVACGPCQLPVCPLDHRCMRAMTPEMVLAAVRSLLDRRPVPEAVRVSH